MNRFHVERHDGNPSKMATSERSQRARNGRWAFRHTLEHPDFRRILARSRAQNA